ncbi:MULTISPECIES: hypothetical protein [Citromicrobium]|uniref:hypothetical protein n=1 Tax=Citromicrobium TaxID=72173 RepID=UPI0012E23D6B|nr:MULTISPECIES: hypothetical protein [Citromicrobium]
MIIDADGAEVPGSRRIGTGSYRRDMAIRAELEAAMGEGCSVVFRDAATAADV